jgi:nicotinate-nucleotide--dimethylbenzimidazole phosphoribosyltransferase
MPDTLSRTLAAISPVDGGLRKKATAHLDNLTKPRGSLGRLEEVAARLYCIAGGQPPGVDPARIFTCAGDHGVTAEGVSPFPQAVTRQMVANFLAGGAGVNVLARTAGVALTVVDAGCAGGDFAPHPSLVSAKVMPGTNNLAEGPAMSVAQCQQAVESGIRLANAAAAEGARCLGMGEMGIGNTTPSTALFCAYMGFTPLEIAGPGAGLSPSGVRQKAEVVRKALWANDAVVSGGDALDILAALGGLEIATLTGLVLGAAANRLPVVVDGFISTAAYVAAWKMHQDVADYAFFSHASAEHGHLMIMEALGARPLLHLDMRLGEGTGAAMAIFVMRCAAAIFTDMATFAAAGVSGQAG